MTTEPMYPEMPRPIATAIEKDPHLRILAALKRIKQRWPWMTLVWVEWSTDSLELSGIDAIVAWGKMRGVHLTMNHFHDLFIFQFMGTIFCGDAALTAPGSKKPGHPREKLGSGPTRAHAIAAALERIA